MAIGSFRSFVLDVDDLAVAERFWRAVLGLDPRFSAWHDQFTRLGRKGEVSVLLQRVPEPKSATKNRAHIDLTVLDVPAAVAEVVALGGRVVQEPGLFPHDDPLLEWAVVCDPCGNEFCVVREVQETL
ncbi:MAG TPA: VOC family protein [Mycobacteriales bacterium]|nr:VOC family protein [Mycobacteriales bacterium]